MEKGDILVTGGCGFIGSHLVNRLINEGHSVVVADDLSTGTLENLNSKAVFCQGDVSDGSFVENVFSSHKIRYIIHQAAKINHSLYGEDPERDINTSVLSTINLIKCSLKHKAERFVFASSVAVYGQPKELPLSENGPAKPVYSYGIAKKCAEDYVRFYAKNYGLDYSILRYANVYGPRQPIYGEVGVVAIFTDNFINEKQFVIFGTGENLRDYIYVDDVIDATLLSMNAPRNNTLNIGCGEGVSVNRLWDIFKSLDSGILCQNKPERTGELGNFYCDVTKAKNLFNWCPKVQIEEGIKRTLEFYKSK
ncbi:MAG: SDR family NAD(P)-dependent oxidoreductase [Planctomycetes bacterium]|nr:SDR family NAD(P)-dependent oxidoreductase [Planctomycetota bacterium]